MVKQQNAQYVSYYTQGSVARNILPAIHAVRAALPKQKRQKRHILYVDPVALLGIVVAVSMLLMMGVGLMQLQAAREETLAMQQYVDSLRYQQEELTQTYEQGYDLNEVERTALALGMIPQEQAKQTEIHVSPRQSVQEEQVTIWEHIGTFLSGMFA
jgi:hypothetical protein